MPRRAVDSVKRTKSLNLKTTEELRGLLEEAARQSGRALTHEVEYRLQQSFDQERMVRIIREELAKALANR